MLDYIIAALAVAQIVTASGCNANNCLRQVRANNFPTRSVTPDCASFLLKTVYPATITATQTITVIAETNSATIIETDVLTAVTTTTVIDGNQVIAPRQATVAPSVIPAYASNCDNVAEYSSACYCIGVTEVTTTFFTPTTTSTVTMSATALTTVLRTTVTTTSATATTRYTCPAVLPTQVVLNPGFESGLANWQLLTGDNEVAFSLSYCGVVGDAPGQDCGYTGALCNCVDVASDSPGGTATLRQTLSGICPGRSYSFVAYLGLSNNVIEGSAGVTTVGASLGGVTLFAPFLPCTDADPCPIPGGSGDFLKIGPITVAPETVDPVLQLDFVSTHPTTIFELDLFVDDITLTLI